MDVGTIFARLLGALQRHPAETELAEELEAHRAMLTEDGIRRGLSREEAERHARIVLGNTAEIHESVRDQAGVRWFESLWQDTRYGLRILRMSPGFTSVAVMALALGIGVNTLMFSVVNSVLLQPLPYRDSGRLVLVQRFDRKSSRAGAVAVPEFEAIRRQSKALEATAAMYQRPVNLTGDGTVADRVQEFIVSADFFDVLGVHPQIGRGFTAADERWGAHRVALLTDGLWKLRYGGDPAIVGRVITLNTEPYQVVGVLPPQMSTFLGMNSQVYVPMSFAPDDMMNGYSNHFLTVLGRLKPNVSYEQAGADLNAIAQTIQQETKSSSSPIYRPSDLREFLVGNVKPNLWVLMGAVGFVLLIACANLANLLLVRAASRTREIAMRSALGASHSRLLRQFLTESTLLSVLGGGLGLLLASWGTKALHVVGPRLLPRVEEVHLDVRVLLFTVAVSLLTGTIFGLAPALHGLRVNLTDVLKDSIRSSGEGSRRRLRGALVVVEVAISLVLLIGAGLMLKSLYRLLQVNAGFDAGNVISSFINLPPRKYSDMQLMAQNKPEALAKAAQYFDDAFARLRAIPGVVAAGGISNLPLTGEVWDKVLTLYDRPLPASVRELPSMQYRVVAGDYFRALDIHVAGRVFNDNDRLGSQSVVIVNRELERRFWPGGTAIGKKLSINPPPALLRAAGIPAGPSEPPRFTIVGVADDVHYGTLQSTPLPVVYGLLSQAGEGVIGLQLVVRTQGNPMALLPAIRDQLAQIDRDVPMANVQPLETLLSRQLATPRLEAVLLGSFAALALVLAVIGVYGVMAYAVTQRTREIGIRLALGAAHRDVLAMVLKSGIALVAAGLAIGLAVALSLTRLLRQMLFGVSTTDKTVFAAITLALAAVAIVASYVPARRATRVDPMVALRYE